MASTSARTRRHSTTRPGSYPTRTRATGGATRRPQFEVGARVRRSDLPRSRNRLQYDWRAELHPSLEADGVVPFPDGRQHAVMVPAADAFGPITDIRHATPVTIEVDAMYRYEPEGLDTHNRQIEMATNARLVSRLFGQRFIPSNQVIGQRSEHLEEFWVTPDLSTPLTALYEPDAQYFSEDGTTQVLWEHKRSETHTGSDFSHRQTLLPLLGERQRAERIGRLRDVRAVFSIAMDPTHWLVQEITYHNDLLSGAEVARAWSVTFSID